MFEDLVDIRHGNKGRELSFVKVWNMEVQLFPTKNPKVFIS
jgi:hypothetical protein